MSTARTIFLVVLLGFNLASSFGGSVTARSIMTEYYNFRTLCVVANVERDGRLDKVVNLDAVNESAKDRINKSLAAERFTQPVVGGRCFPRDANSDVRQLSLIFHVAVADDSRDENAVLLAVIVHSYFQDISYSPHAYPTRISVCPRSEITICTIGAISNYFDGIVLPIFLKVRSIVTGKP
jgi:uncharacterized protein YifN (PemK superfamily)